MKHLKWVAGLSALAVIPVLAWAGIANAQKFTNTVDQGHTIDSSLYSAGKTIDINGTVNGDIFCAGQTVKIDATVHGDVICAGQDVTVSGKIDGNVRLAGQTVNVDADIARSATLAGMNVSLDASSKVGRDLTASGDTLNIKGMVGRDAVVSGTSLTFNGNVGRNVKASGSNVRVKDGAMVAGNFEYTSSKKAGFDKGSAIKGDTHRITPAKKGSRWHFNATFYLFALAGMLLVSLALVYIFPQFMRKNAGHIKESFGKTLAVGLVASFAVPLLSLGLVLSVVGIPLTFFLMVAWIFGVMLSGPIVAFYIGQRVLAKQKSPLLVVSIGSILLVSAYFLPLAGILIIMVAYWLGLGALLITLKAHAKPFQPKPAK